MADRSILHKDRVQEFQSWCIAQGHDVRGPVGQYQICQIRLQGQTIWWALYFRDYMPEHVSVVRPLIPLVRQWLKGRRCPLCKYQHGHQIGCDNNPVDIELRASAASTMPTQSR